MVGWPVWRLCQMAAVRASRRCATLRDAGGDALDGAAAVQFRVELVFEGVVDRLDQRPHRFEQPFAGVGCRRSGAAVARRAGPAGRGPGWRCGPSPISRIEDLAWTQK